MSCYIPAFWNVLQNYWEGIVIYAAELKTMASICNLSDKKKYSIIGDSLVRGWWDPALKEKLLKEEDWTQDKCDQFARIVQGKDLKKRLELYIQSTYTVQLRLKGFGLQTTCKYCTGSIECTVRDYMGIRRVWKSVKYAFLHPELSWS